MEPLLFSAKVVEHDFPQEKRLRLLLIALNNPAVPGAMPAGYQYRIQFGLDPAAATPLGLTITPVAPSDNTTFSEAGVFEYIFDTAAVAPWLLGTHIVSIHIERSKETGDPFTRIEPNPQVQFLLLPPQAAPAAAVSLSRFTPPDTSDEILWEAIKASQIEFSAMNSLVNEVLCAPGILGPDSAFANRLPFVQVGEYAVLKFTVEAYMMAMSSPDAIPSLGGYLVNNKNLGGSAIMPYFDLVLEKLSDIKFTKDQLDQKSCLQRLVANAQSFSLFELIWNYWMEEAGLVQTMNAISYRYQNIKLTSDLEPLYRLDTDLLRPVSNLLWGYIQDEQHTLSLHRRAYEYDHAYGVKLLGKAVPNTQGVDSRSKFLEGFHTLLHKCAIYYKQSDDTTVIPDGFPVLNAVREVNLLLAEGFHNAYANLTWTARHEMLVQQYLLARPEMREFLGGRIMVPYAEPWMDKVDTTRGMMGWGDTSVSYFWELATYGELILLSVRFGAWSRAIMPAQAANWANAFRDMVMRYIHAYRVVTGVDLSADTMQLNAEHYAQPAKLIRQRVANSRNNGTGRTRNGVRLQAAEMA